MSAPAIISFFDPLFAAESLDVLNGVQYSADPQSILGRWKLYGGVSGSPLVSLGNKNDPPFYAVTVNNTFIVGVAGVQNFQQGFNAYASTLTDVASSGEWSASAIVAAQAVTVLEAIRSRLPPVGTNIVLVGHSYGGAVVEVLALLLYRLGYRPNQTNVIAAGSPRPGLIGIQRSLGFNGLRYMNQFDPIPYFPPHGDEFLPVDPTYGFFAPGFDDYVHPFIGMSMDNTGVITIQPLPKAERNMAASISIVLWAAGDALYSKEHSLPEYVRRLRLAGAVNPEFVQVPPALVFPGQIGGRVPSRVLGNLDVPGDHNFTARSIDVAVFVPLQYRFKKTRTAAGLWCVTWMGVQVTTGQSQSNANAVAKWGNKWLRNLGTANQIDGTKLSMALGLFLGTAKQGGNGFIPVWVVT
jgi:pimeloyl-ACP methyl ester carboxylesterase